MESVQGGLASLVLAKGKSPLPAGCMQCLSESAMHGYRAYNCALTQFPAETKGFVLHEFLTFWKCWNDIVSLMQSIIAVSSHCSLAFVLVWLFIHWIRSAFMTSLRLPMCSVGKSVLLSRL